MVAATGNCYQTEFRCIVCTMAIKLLLLLLLLLYRCHSAPLSFFVTVKVFTVYLTGQLSHLCKNLDIKRGQVMQNPEHFSIVLGFLFSWRWKVYHLMSLFDPVNKRMSGHILQNCQGWIKHQKGSFLCLFGWFPMLIGSLVWICSAPHLPLILPGLSICKWLTDENIH